MKRYITIDSNTQVVMSVRYDGSDGELNITGSSSEYNGTYKEIESETGEAGQIKQEDGSFVWSEIDEDETNIPKQTTLEELEHNQVVIMDAIAILFEKVSASRGE